MKSNILIIAAVIVFVMSVIVAVIAASIMNSPKTDPYNSSDNSYSVISSGGEPVPVQPGDSGGDEPNIPAGRPADSAQTTLAQNIVFLANSLIGTPFEENGAGPDGFDNSGFIYYVLRESGFITCPRTTEAQSEMGTRVGYDEIREGDLVFFSDDGGEGVSFGGIYAGSGIMIACLMPGTEVKQVDITTDYYRGHFAAAVGIC